MQTIFSTADVPPIQRFDYWHDIACRHIVQRDSHKLCDDFHATLQIGYVSDFHFGSLKASPIFIERTAHHIAKSCNQRSDDLIFLRTTSGAFHFDQHDCESSLTAGAMMLFDPMRPYRAQYHVPTEVLMLSVPRTAMVRRIGSIETVRGRIIAPSADAGLLAYFCNALSNNLDGLSATAEATLKDHGIDLLAVALSGMLDRQPVLTTTGRMVAFRLRIFIESHLDDAALDRETIAAAVGISVRHANELLAEEGTSIMHLVHELRLTRCRHDLADPRQAHRSVGSIAYRWGFRDLSVFGRSFKKAYGYLPSDYRRLMLEPAAAQKVERNRPPSRLS